jgi:hypothetical protein
MNSTLEGLQVSVLSLLITFLALGVFILVMVILQRLFPPPAEELVEEAGPALEEPLALEVTSPDESEEGAVAAAIAAAIAYFQLENRDQLGGSLREGRGAWWASHCSQALFEKVERR